MNDKPKQIDPLPDEFTDYEAAAAFWDEHDTTDYLDNFETVTTEAKLEKRRFEVEVDENLMKVLQSQARARGVEINHLVTEALEEKIRRAA